MTITHVTQSGHTASLALPAAVKIVIQPVLVHQAVVTEQANARAPHGHTKTRAEVSGGGRKPWRQKGTGRARASSIRSPLWAGGGITFGPRPNRNFRKRLNTPMRHRAFAMALASQLAAGRVWLVDETVFRHDKTASAGQALAKIGPLGRRPVVIFGRAEGAPIRVLRNLAGLQIELAASVPLTRLLGATRVLADQGGLNGLLRRAFGVELPAAGEPAVKPKQTKRATPAKAKTKAAR